MFQRKQTRFFELSVPLRLINTTQVSEKNHHLLRNCVLSTTSKCLEKQEKIIQKHLIRNTPLSNVKFINSMQPSSWSHLMNHIILFSELTLGTEPGEMLADIFPCQLAHSSLRPASSAACRYAAPFPKRSRHLEA